MGSIEDPHCPECGEPIGQTATYCMHCSADLSDRDSAAFAEGAASSDDWVGSPDDGSAASTDTAASTDEEPRFGDAGSSSATVQDHAEAISDTVSETTGRSDQLLDPDGMVDNTLTVIVGVAGGIVVGLIGTIVLGALTGSGWALLFGLVVWLGSTAYLVRRRTVQGAVAKSGYAVALVLLSVPLIAVSPFVPVEGGIQQRGTLFFTMLLFVTVPATIAAIVGVVASQFVPDGDSGG